MGLDGNALYAYGGGHRRQCDGAVEPGPRRSHKEDYAEAERQLRDALRLELANIFAMGNLASLYIKLKKLTPPGLSRIRTIIGLCSNGVKAYSLMAKALSDQGKRDQAEDCLQRALEFEPASISCATVWH